MNTIQKILLYPCVERDLRTFDYSLVWLEYIFRSFASMFISFFIYSIFGNTIVMYVAILVLSVWIISYLFITEDYFLAND